MRRTIAFKLSLPEAQRLMMAIAFSRDANHKDGFLSEASELGELLSRLDDLVTPEIERNQP